jgi:hypothetical protein
MIRARVPVLRRLMVILAAAVAVLGVSASAVARPGKGHSHLQRFVILQTDPNANTQVVVAGGPIHARGVDTPTDDTHDVFAFPKGTVSVTHVAKHTHQSFDPVNCYGRVTERGTYRITGGTGAYANVRGHGTYEAEINIVGCDENSAPDVLSVVVKAHGPLFLSGPRS